MYLSNILHFGFRLLFLPALISTAYLYTYPAFQGCHFPTPLRNGAQAPFRLLALGDPQLEGNTALPSHHRDVFHTWSQGTSQGWKDRLRSLVEEDLAIIAQEYRKRLDLWGNDLYLAHIYRSVRWWTGPSHVTVLGDLLGSQWISDEEFQSRTNRFWDRVFRGALKVPQTVMDGLEQEHIIGKDPLWNRRIIALPGNHDIGYAGDVDPGRIERFERAFGQVNWMTRFRLEESHLAEQSSNSESLGSPPELRVVVLNSMNLDLPAKHPEIQQENVDFVKEQIHTQKPSSTGTILLTHIPFHKESGVCVDAPYFSFFPPENGGGIREQNHLSQGMTNYILSGLLGDDGSSTAVVLNGHDHEGCDTLHQRIEVDDEAGQIEDTRKYQWRATRYGSMNTAGPDNRTSIMREITVRSMMGSFGGNAGLLSADFDKESGTWKFEYSTCTLGVQHIWWAIHIVDLVTVGLGSLSLISHLIERTVSRKSRVQIDRKRKVV